MRDARAAVADDEEEREAREEGEAGKQTSERRCRCEEAATMELRWTGGGGGCCCCCK